MASPSPVPAPITAQGPFGSRTPSLSVTRSAGFTAGMPSANVWKSLARRTERMPRSAARSRSSRIQGRLVVWLRPLATGPATPNPAYCGMGRAISDAKARQMAPRPGYLRLSYRLLASTSIEGAPDGSVARPTSHTARSVLVPPMSPASTCMRRNLPDERGRSSDEEALSRRSPLACRRMEPNFARGRGRSGDSHADCEGGKLGGDGRIGLVDGGRRAGGDDVLSIGGWQLARNGGTHRGGRQLHPASRGGLAGDRFHLAQRG